ncbi:uncharacterized protein C14orf119 homolog [Clarias gariepinus]|uniref:uncharacterized protein C14orf119 homolog n=1 Tax=Clarias gariepinus TaxID=13013 RepID=UPI00234D37C1|nr:uncharacterized protein C14orf119 homolog [Clarias gariepinus]
MAWFHHAMQDASLPQSHSMKNHTLDNHACLESNPRSAIPLALSESQALPQLLQSSNTSYPTDSNKIVCPQEGEQISSLNQTNGPVHMSYVTLQEQRCVINWFLGWGCPQKECFLQDLISKAVPGKVCSLLEHLNKLQVKDHSPNIFDCQLRLWTQWFDTWTEEERNAFLTSLEEKDPMFVGQFYKELASTAGRD